MVAIYTDSPTHKNKIFYWEQAPQLLKSYNSKISVAISWPRRLAFARFNDLAKLLSHLRSDLFTPYASEWNASFQAHFEIRMLIQKENIQFRRKEKYFWRIFGNFSSMKMSEYKILIVEESVDECDNARCGMPNVITVTKGWFSINRKAHLRCGFTVRWQNFTVHFE